jgi:dihydroxyacetone kinase
MVKATAGAKQGMEKTSDMIARRGRSAKLGERSVGHIDPGAASTYLTLRAMTEALRDALGQKTSGR